MGHALMDKVLNQWSDLPGNAFKVLLLMARTGMDNELVPVYYGGWERLAMTALGRHVWPADDDDSDDAKRTRRAGFEIARKAVRDLKQAGAIKVTKRGKTGNQARYSLHLDAANLWITRQRRTESVRSDARKACVERTESVRQTHGKRGAKETRETRETRGEPRSSSETTHLAREDTSGTSTRLRLVREAADADHAAQSSLEQGRPPTLTERLKEMSP